MPTVLRTGPYRFILFSSDGSEPPQVHVFRDNADVKFWLNPVRLDGSHRFRPDEVRRIERLVGQHQDQLLRAWREHFPS
jgi:hypothetical protein